MELTLESLDEHLVQLIKIDNIKHKILTRLECIKNKLKENEIIVLNIVKDGQQFKVIFNIVNESLPKCFIIDNQYKFNSRIEETIIFTKDEYK